MEKNKIAMPRVVNYIIGMIMISSGMASMLAVEMGMAPTSSFPVTVYEITQLFTAGRWITFLQILFIIGAVVVGRHIRVSHILSFATAILLGYLVDLFEILLIPFVPSAFIIRLIIPVIACFIMSIGVSFLLLSGYPPVPDLYFMHEMEKRYNISVGRIKIIIDVSAVVIASILSVFVLHKFVHVGIGTVVSALSLGFLITKAKPVIHSRFTNSKSRLKHNLISVLDYDLLNALKKSH